MDEFDRLRSLLLHDEWRRLAELENRLKDPGWEAEKMAELLPDALRVGARRDRRLADSLQQPVEASLKVAIRRDIQGFADALFPVMGPAIRKSIAESLRGLVQTLNHAVEHSVSWRGLKWRFEAWRSGRPFGEVVLSHTLRFRVEEVFLIHRETGLLLQHVSAEGVTVRDSDAISAMLNAIQDFVRDSFAAPESQMLDTIEMGEHVVWIEQGPHAILACVIRGIPPVDLRAVLQDTLEAVHRSFRSELEEFTGDASALAMSRGLLENCLRSEALEESEGRGGLSPAFKAMLTLLALALLILTGWGVYRYLEERRLLSYLADLQANPGIVVIAHGRENGRWVVRGLRDPLSEDPVATARRMGMHPDKLVFQWTPYQDLAPAFVEQRARRVLEPPATVDLTVQDRVLQVGGHADPDWIDRAQQRVPVLAGLIGVDMTGLMDSDAFLLKRIRALLTPPETVTAQIKGGILTLTGEAPLNWIASVKPRLEGLEGLAEIRLDQLVPAERRQFQAVRERVESASIRFISDTVEFEPGQAPALQALTTDIESLVSLGSRLNLKMKLRLIGHADQTGSAARNQRLRLERAQALLSYLENAGVDPRYLEASAGETRERQVTFRVSVGDKPALPGDGD